MEMALLRRYAPQLPLWIHHSARGGLLVSHGDCPRQDNWGVPLCFRFLASAANSVSSVSVRPQYLPVPARAGCHWQHPSSAKKDMLQNSARAQGQRLFHSPINWFVKPDNAKHVLSFATARNKLQEAVKANNRDLMRQELSNLKEFAEDKDYYGNEYRANRLLKAVVSPLGKDQLHKHGGLDDGVVKESLEVVRLLLQNAPDEIRIKLEVELKPILERIRDSGGSADHEVIKLANEILAQPPSTPLAQPPSTPK